MGTNYYYHESGERECPHCHQETPNRHIGKSSHGWCFSLHIYPRDGIAGLDDWREVWTQGGAIFDEYGEQVTPERMLAVILERDERRCRSHVEGARRWSLDCRRGGPTYDLCNYEFS